MSIYTHVSEVLTTSFQALYVCQGFLGQKTRHFSFKALFKTQEHLTFNRKNHSDQQQESRADSSDSHEWKRAGQRRRV
ncbi:UNVERIFIED_CONTAM: hypothetical protein FKN15_025070 [Acipenser sinensis]